jgi:SnoaL-like domain
MGEFSGARSGEAIEQRLARLEDIEAIQRLKERYAYYCDNGYDADGFTSLFIDEAVWESNAFGVYQGKNEIHSFISGIQTQILWATHFMICPAITVAPDGRSATGRWYLLELATMTGADDQNGRDAVVMAANYEDSFVKENGEWKFRKVKVHFHNVSNLDQGWAKQQYR